MANLGVIFAVLGMALASLLPGIGSAKGVGITGQAAAGAISENPDLFGRVLVLQLLPGTQGIYGLLIAFIVMMQIGLVGTAGVDITLYKGLAYLLACLPVSIVGYLSALYQAKTSVSAIQVIVKEPNQFGRAMVFPVMVETYAILALLVSLLAVFNIGALNI